MRLDRDKIRDELEYRYKRSYLRNIDTLELLTKAYMEAQIGTPYIYKHRKQIRKEINEILNARKEYMDIIKVLNNTENNKDFNNTYGYWLKAGYYEYNLLRYEKNTDKTEIIYTIGDPHDDWAEYKTISQCKKWANMLYDTILDDLREKDIDSENEAQRHDIFMKQNRIKQDKKYIVSAITYTMFDWIRGNR